MQIIYSYMKITVVDQLNAMALGTGCRPPADVKVVSYSQLTIAQEQSTLKLSDITILLFCIHQWICKGCVE